MALPRSPRNAVSAPAEREMKKWPGAVEQLVIARLVWPDGTELVPARVVQSSFRLVLVEWSRGVRMRRTWLPREDVADSVPARVIDAGRYAPRPDSTI